MWENCSCERFQWLPQLPCISKIIFVSLKTRITLELPLVVRMLLLLLMLLTVLPVVEKFNNIKIDILVLELLRDHVSLGLLIFRNTTALEHHYMVKHYYKLSFVVVVMLVDPCLNPLNVLSLEK